MCRTIVHACGLRNRLPHDRAADKKLVEIYLPTTGNATIAIHWNSLHQVSPPGVDRRLSIRLYSASTSFSSPGLCAQQFVRFIRFHSAVRLDGLRCKTKQRNRTHTSESREVSNFMVIENPENELKLISKWNTVCLPSAHTSAISIHPVPDELPRKKLPETFYLFFRHKETN